MSKNSGNMKNIGCSKIIGIQFSILSPEEIRRGSVAEITSKEAYINNKPVINGLFDPRMGVLEPGLICPTDGLDYMQTPGYFGHIELARPVFYIQYLSTIQKVLRCVCFKCSKLLISKEKYKQALKMQNQDRWKYVHALCKDVKRCGDESEDGCGCLQPKKIKKEGVASLFAEWLNTSEEGDENIVIPLIPELVLKIFKRISDEDVTFMGFSPVYSRPDWMICQVLAVPPPAVRPSVKHDAQQRSEDDLTHILVNIVKTNKTLQEKIQNNAPENIINDWTVVLQYNVASMVDNKLPNASPVAQRSGRPFKSIKDRLNGKGGRMRGNLMAKRVDFSARSVITADPNISIRELGIPMKIAKNITKPVIVNRVNKAFLTKLVQNGPDVWPGAKILERQNGQNITLRYLDRKSIVLEDGDIVHRHMMDGDAILFNRQPTLHRMSMMCHIARIMKRGDTFRMNVADTKPYNADFDGDEMNLHMPQDPEAESELKNLAAVPYQIISPANNSAIIGIYQDSMLGSYRFTRENIDFTQKEAMNLLMMFNRVNPSALKKKRNDRISNFEILSQMMPPLTLKVDNGQFDSEKEKKETSNNVVEIIDGKYIRGQMDKGILGSGTKGLIHRSCNDFGNMAAAQFIDDLQNIVTEYMKQSAFSVGISDLIIDEKTSDKIVATITEKKNEVKNTIDQLMIGAFENNSGKSNQEEFETKVNNILSKAQNDASKEAFNNLSKDNRFVVMVNAGSKGSKLNIQQMVACLGQQTVEGKRIPYGFEHRTLPHYTKYDDSAIARGFVESSFINGMSPQELFFHAMGGRVGLIDTAVKTSTTGYIQRRLIKGLEDLMINYDMTIRTNKNKIVQFSYGDDSIDTVKVENQVLPIVDMSIQDIYAHFAIVDDKAKSKALSGMFIKTAYTRQKKQADALQEKCQFYIDFIIKKRSEIVKNVFNNKSDKVVRVPVAFHYIIQNIIGQQGINSNSLVDITMLETFTMIEDTYDKLQKIVFAPPTELFKVLFYYYLSPKDLLINKRFNKKALEILMETIILAYKRAIVAPGEMVGMIAAQSIGEPTTQMTLNSVSYETPIIVRNRDGFIQKIQIGDFIENKIKVATKTKYYADKDTTYSELDNYYEIPSCTEDGKMIWKQIEAVTKHPVVNTDGTNTMLKITTKEEREVIVTKAKSVLKLINGKIVPINGSDLKVGDYMPVSKLQIEFNETRELNLKTILSPTEYIYTSEVEKAKAVMKQHKWWSKHQGTTFILPYSRSDSFVAKVNGIVRNGCKTKTSFAPNCVYVMKSNINDYQIPENLPLDYNLGYLIGAYAAEGCMTKFQVAISNNENSYFEPILEFCKKHKLTTKIYRNENKNKNGWTSQDIRIYSTVLCRLLEHFCGKLSHNKFVSDKIIFSNKDCLLGFMDAYIGGDGYVNINKTPEISMSSVSKKLLIDVQQILNILGCYGKILKFKKPETNNRGSKNIKQLYTLFVRNKQAQKLATQLNIKLEYKQENLKKILTHQYKYLYSRKDTMVPNEIHGNIVMIPREQIINCVDTYFDKIISIEEVPNTTNYAYDLTVSDTKTFNIYNGLALMDTFHHAGVASKSNVTRGVPRIEELLSLSSLIKNPSLTIFLKPEDQTDKDKANTIQYMIEYTKLEEIVKNVEICFDPDDLNTLIAEDKSSMSQFREFENMVDECLGQDASLEETEKSKWIIRMEMDPETMLEKNITMDDVNFTLNNTYKDEISCVYSDYNSDKLIFRIRMNNVLKSSSGKGQKKAKVNPLDQSDQIYILKNFQDQLLNGIVLRGVKNIDKVILRKVKDNLVEKGGAYKKEDIWVLDTIGTNLLDVLGLDYIDSSRTVSNDIMEIFNTLGMEATRQCLYNELAEVLEFDGSYVNAHHMTLLCDRMTFSHKLISIFRHGINNDDIGPIAKASFEETPEMFLKAARHAELDTLRGISANVMCGQEGLFGTASFQVVLDINEMIKLEEKYKYEYEDKEELITDGLFSKIEDPIDLCSTQSLQVKTNVSNIKREELGGDNDYDPFA